MTIWQLVCILAGMMVVGGLILCLNRELKGGVSTAIFGVIIWLLAYKIDTKHSTPTALDVYRGKTTLEITYRDSVAIDSTVVYKVK